MSRGECRPLGGPAYGSCGVGATGGEVCVRAVVLRLSGQGECARTRDALPHRFSLVMKLDAVRVATCLNT